MIIELIGVPRRIRRGRILNAVKYFADALISKRLQSNTTLRIVFSKNLSKNDGLDACCMWEDDNLRPREFMIQIDKDLTEESIFLYLAHEMVHLKQYLKGELVDLLRSPQKCKWMGKRIDENAYDYHDLPWEIEAYELENPLYEGFINEETKQGT